MPFHEKPTYSETTRGLRWALIGSGANAFFFYITFGSSVFVLFLNQLGFAKTQVGLLLSFLPFCAFIALFSAPVTARIGIKRGFLIFFGVRKFIILTLLATPWVLAQFGMRATFCFVGIIVFLFAICRALAESCSYPWSQEYVPNKIRGKYSGISNIVVTLVGAAALTFASLTIKHGYGLHRFMLLIGAGVVAGLISVVMFAFVPGGHPIDLPDGHRSYLREIRQVVRDRNFMRYLFGMALGTLAISLVGFLPLFMKERVGLHPNQIVLLDTAIMIGTLLSSYLWGGAADRLGSKPVLLAGGSLMALIPFAWIAMPCGSAWSLVAALIIAFCWGASMAGYGIGSSRLLFNDLMRPEQRTGYSAMWYAFNGVVAGVGPLLAGRSLDALKDWQRMVLGRRIDEYTLFFLTCACLLAGGIFLLRTIREASRAGGNTPAGAKSHREPELTGETR